MNNLKMIKTVVWEPESNTRKSGLIITTEDDAYFFVAMEIPITTAINKENRTVSLWATVSDSATVVISVPLSIPANIAMGMLRLECERYYEKNKGTKR